jgi:ketosteroid isomerase-like protein
MSRENVETLRAMMAAFNRRDFEDSVRYVDPEVELHPGITELDVNGRYRGRDEFRRFAETITDAWETYVVEPEEIIEVPDGRVLAVERWRARGRQGIKFDFLLVDVYTFRDGLIVRIDGFRDREAAFEAVGLRE